VDKSQYDICLEVLRLCINNKDQPRLVALFKNISQKQQKKVIKSFKDNEAEDILRILNS